MLQVALIPGAALPAFPYAFAVRVTLIQAPSITENTFAGTTSWGDGAA